MYRGGGGGAWRLCFCFCGCRCLCAEDVCGRAAVCEAYMGIARAMVGALIGVTCVCVYVCEAALRGA